VNWKYKQHEIYLNEETGTFSTYVQDGDSQHKTIIGANSLEELKKKIDKHLKQTIKKGIKLFAKDGYEETLEVKEVEITSISSDSTYREYWTKDKEGNRRKYSHSDLLKYIPEKVEVVIELVAKIKKLKEQLETILDELELDNEEIYALLGVKQVNNT